MTALAYSPPRPSALLVSVRSGAEALEALAGGADLIDVKEPTRGSLGRAEPAVLTEVLGAVAGRRRVSAALGELREEEGKTLSGLPTELAYVKWGLAGYSNPEAAQQALAETRHQLSSLLPRCGMVAVAYADWERACSPVPEVIARWAATLHCPVVLLDTWKKDGTTLLDWLAPERISALIAQCRRSGLEIALAGSLGETEILQLRTLRPTWFAVRGAACRAGQRTATVCRDRVSNLARLLQESLESQSEKEVQPAP